MASRRVLLLGATGRLGRHVLRALGARSDVEVTALVRSAAKLRTQIGEEADSARLLERTRIVEGAIEDEALLTAAMKEAGACIMTAGYPNDGVDGQPSSLARLFPIVARTAAAALQAPHRLVALGGGGALDNGSAGLLYTLAGFPPQPAGYSRVHEANWHQLQRLTAATPAFQWSFFCPGFMVDAPETAPLHVAVDKAAIFDASGAPTTATAFAPTIFGAMNVPYSGVARYIVQIALGDADVDGRPADAYLGHRICVFKGA